MKRSSIKTAVLILLLTVIAVSCTPKTESTTPSDFYKNKTVDLIICGSPGTNYDLIGRIMAQYLGNETGASVIVANRSGAGGTEGLNYLNQSKPDGLTLGMSGSIKCVSNKVLDDPVAKYDIEKFSYIAGVGRKLIYFFISPERSYQTLTDLKSGKDLKIGGATPSGFITLAGLTSVKALDLDAKVILGFEGESERALAVKRGEVIGYCTHIQSVKSYIESGMLKPMFVFATKRDPLTPDVPSISELVNLSGENLALIKLWETGLVSSALFLAPPGVPEDRLAFLRMLVDRWIQDEKFCKEINAVSGNEVQEYVTGENLNKQMVDMASELNKFQSLFAHLIKTYTN